MFTNLLELRKNRNKNKKQHATTLQTAQNNITNNKILKITWSRACSLLSVVFTLRARVKDNKIFVHSA